METGKRNWEKFGKKDPYYWVTTDSKYKDGSLTEDVRKDFFESADNYENKIQLACIDIRHLGRIVCHTLS